MTVVDSGVSFSSILDMKVTVSLTFLKRSISMSVSITVPVVSIFSTLH